MSICIRKNFIKKFSKNCRPKTGSRHFCLQRIKAQLLLENEILEARHIRQVIANLSKFVQMNMLISTESFLKKILWKYLILKFAWPLCFPAEIFYITKEKNYQKLRQKLQPENWSQALVFAKNLTWPILENETFEASYLH